jgi:hypothetical protein
MPASGPWLRISDVSDYLNVVKQKLVFPIHNALLSSNGHALYNDRIGEATRENGGNFVVLELGQSLEV